MNGSAFIINSEGLYASNDCEMTTARTVIKDDDGKPVSSKHTQTVRVMNYMKVSGQLDRYQDCYCQFKFDETDVIQTFSATISGFTDEMMILNLKALNLHNEKVTETIKNKIKEEISYGS